MRQYSTFLCKLANLTGCGLGIRYRYTNIRLRCPNGSVLQGTHLHLHLPTPRDCVCPRTRPYLVAMRARAGVCVCVCVCVACACACACAYVRTLVFLLGRCQCVRVRVHLWLVPLSVAVAWCIYGVPPLPQLRGRAATFRVGEKVGDVSEFLFNSLTDPSATFSLVQHPGTSISLFLFSSFVTCHTCGMLPCLRYPLRSCSPVRPCVLVAVYPLSCSAVPHI